MLRCLLLANQIAAATRAHPRGMDRPWGDIAAQDAQSWRLWLHMPFAAVCHLASAIVPDRRRVFLLRADTHRRVQTPA